MRYGDCRSIAEEVKSGGGKDSLLAMHPDIKKKAAAGKLEYKEPPELDSDLFFYVEAFYFLFRGEAILISEIILWLQLQGSFDLEYEVFLVKGIERFVLEYLDKKQRKQMEAQRLASKRKS